MFDHKSRSFRLKWLLFGEVISAFSKSLFFGGVLKKSVHSCIQSWGCKHLYVAKHFLFFLTLLKVATRLHSLFLDDGVSPVTGA